MGTAVAKLPMRGEPGTLIISGTGTKLGGNGKRHEQPDPSEKLMNSQDGLGSTKIPSPKTSHSFWPRVLEYCNVGQGAALMIGAAGAGLSAEELEGPGEAATTFHGAAMGAAMGDATGGAIPCLEVAFTPAAVRPAANGPTVLATTRQACNSCILDNGCLL